MSDVNAKDPDYEGLAEWLIAVMERQSLQPGDIVRRGGPSLPTIREVILATPRKKRPAILRRLSEAAGYPPDTAIRILNRQPVEPPAADLSASDVSRLLAAMEKMTTELAQMRQDLQAFGRNASGAH